MNSQFETPVPKIAGADAELGNSIQGPGFDSPHPGLAAALLLNEIAGVPQRRSTTYQTRIAFPAINRDANHGSTQPLNLPWANCQDWGRIFLKRTGGSAYIDLNHLEIPLPETRSAFEFNATWHAALRIVQQAARAVNRRLGKGYRVHVVANNSDGLGNSYGSHLEILLSRRAFDNLFDRKPHQLMFLASHQASSIVICGQGKVGSENGRPQVDFQISQRADFFETLQGLQTTYRRPLVNSRDESLCGELNHCYARLHNIFYDSNLQHTATILKVGMLQMICTLFEVDYINPNLLLDDPVLAVVKWSHDPHLAATARMANGKRTTAVDLQRRFLDHAWKYQDRHGFDGAVPDASEILDLWASVLERLRRFDFHSLLGALDWILKQHLIEQCIQRSPHLTFQSPEIKHLDWLYSNLDPDAGLYWACQRNGLVRQITTDDEISRYMSAPPNDTRAWCRSKLLERAGDRVSYMDWDRIEFSLSDRNGWTRIRTFHMPDPLGLTERQVGHLFTNETPLSELLNELEAHGASANLDNERNSHATTQHSKT